jgi:hypothetical protein
MRIGTFVAWHDLAQLALKATKATVFGVVMKSPRDDVVSRVRPPRVMQMPGKGIGCLSVAGIRIERSREALLFSEPLFPTLQTAIKLSELLLEQEIASLDFLGPIDACAGCGQVASVKAQVRCTTQHGSVILTEVDCPMNGHPLVFIPLQRKKRHCVQ